MRSKKKSICFKSLFNFQEDEEKTYPLPFENTLANYLETRKKESLRVAQSKMLEIIIQWKILLKQSSHVINENRQHEIITLILR